MPGHVAAPPIVIGQGKGCGIMTMFDSPCLINCDRTGSRRQSGSRPPSPPQQALAWSILGPDRRPHRVWAWGWAVGPRAVGVCAGQETGQQETGHSRKPDGSEQETGHSRKRDTAGNGTGPILLSQATFLLAHIANNQPRPEAVVLGRPPEGAVYVRLPPLGAWSWSRPGFSQAPAEASPLMTNSRLIQCHARVLPSPDQNGKTTPDRSKLFGSHGQRLG